MLIFIISFNGALYAYYQPVCPTMTRRAMHECRERTSLDLELDLQASRTRQSRLNDELQSLRDLKQRLEEMKANGETELPPYVLEDERFQKLLKQAEKKVIIPCYEPYYRNYHLENVLLFQAGSVAVKQPITFLFFFPPYWEW